MNDRAEVIAFYLPQYYPIKENNEWFGEGFTEWTNVGKSQPLYKNHYQPKVPADLGYYDLRLPEVRAYQARLARMAGISAFCYYHYWFGHGKQMLEMPLNEVIRIKEPNFPFCICWANHTWYKKTWDADKNVLDKKPLLKQDYPGLDDAKEHFYTLLTAFKDKRYYKINGKLVFVMYRAEDVPYMEELMKQWEELALQEGLPGFYFMSYVDDEARLKHPIHKKFETTILCCKSNVESIGKGRFVRKISRFLRAYMAQTLHIPLNVHQYKDVRKKLISPLFQEENISPVIMPNWDNTPRRGVGAQVWHNATPEQFELLCSDIFSIIRNKRNKVVFLKSWNEWGEGNYMEPCIKYGRGYITALYNALTKKE